MTDQALADTAVPTSHMDPLGDTERALVEGVVYDGWKRNEIHKKLGCSDRWVRALFRKPEVLKALRDETQVLRAGVRPQAIRNLDEIGRQRRNLTAATAASAKLMGEDERSRVAVNINITPGYAVDLGDRSRERLIEGEVIRVDDVADTPSTELDE